MSGHVPRDRHVIGERDTPRDTGATAARTIAALVFDAETLARLRDAAGRRFLVAACESWDAVVALIAGGRAAAVLTEPRDRGNVSIAPRVRLLREGYPSIPVIGYIRGSRTISRDILDLARAGVNELVHAGFDDVGVAFRAALASASASCIAERLLSELSPAIPPAVWGLVAFCVERANAPLSVRELAHAFAVDPRTVERRFRESGMPSPREVIGWARLLLASTLLEDAGRPLEQVAYTLDFPSGAALRNMLRRYTDLRPQELRENGGHRCVVHLFKQAIARSQLAPAAS
jgi:AraC-like DNA-binding protein